MAQTKVSTLDDRIKSIDANMVTTADCLSQTAVAGKSNAADLLYGGQVCAAVKMPLEASFLLLVGQLRAVSDIVLMPPATQSDDRGLMPLYGLLYAGGGMSGVDDNILHDPEKRARLLALLDQWSPSYGPNYDPGWNARKRPDAEKYAATIAQAKADLRKDLDRLVRLDSDDQYYAMQRQYNEVLARIPKTGGLAPGTPDAKLMNDLDVRMRARGIALGVDMGPPPPDPKELAKGGMATAGFPTDFPPPAPEKSESVIPSSADQTIEKCTDQAERTAVSRGGTIKRKLVYTSLKWGTVVRADIVGGDMGPQRFTCTANFTGTQPFEIGKLQPLRE
jgi:hypothetical protein